VLKANASRFKFDVGRFAWLSNTTQIPKVSRRPTQPTRRSSSRRPDREC
jgi:hypothetical protein